MVFTNIHVVWLTPEKHLILAVTSLNSKTKEGSLIKINQLAHSVSVSHKSDECPLAHHYSFGCIRVKTSYRNNGERENPGSATGSVSFEVS